MSTRTELTQRRRKAHHAALKELSGLDGLTLWRKLRRIETELFRACENYSNGTNGVDLPAWEEAKRVGRNRLINAFGGTIPQGVFINSDPRGHMLKLDCDVRSIPDGMERDMGGNGILAAEID